MRNKNTTSRSEGSQPKERKQNQAKAPAKRVRVKIPKIPTTPEFKKLVDKHLNIAMEEIGPIRPWFDEECQEWVFEHPYYPESYGGDTPEEVIERYPLYIRQFIEHRLIGNIDPKVDVTMKGRGGKREGAGRPKGTSKEPTKVIRLPIDIAMWLQGSEDHLHKVRKLMSR